MKTLKRIGIWMDHSVAYLMESKNNKIWSGIIESQSNFQEHRENFKSDESLMQNLEQNQLSGYFKRIGNVVMNYNEVLLFGPTHAKNELFNVLKLDHHFDSIKIELKTADKMTENQMHAFFKMHFNI